MSPKAFRACADGGKARGPVVRRGGQGGTPQTGPYPFNCACSNSWLPFSPRLLARAFRNSVTMVNRSKHGRSEEEELTQGMSEDP